MKHYVLVLDWATNYEEDVNIIGVFHTLEDAERLYKETLSNERKLAEEKGYEVETDDNVCFTAYEEGNYMTEHTRLYIQEV